MRNAIWVVGFVGAVAAGAFACSGASTSGGGPGACLQSAAGSSCYACIQSNCGSSLSTFENACGPFVDCMCSSGSYDGCNAQACSSQISPACESATSGLGSCSACASECSGFGLDTCTGSGSSSGVGGSSGIGGSSGGGSCLSGATNSACWSCMQGQCGSQLGAFESDCGGYIACMCPAGTYEAGNATTCESQITGTCDTGAQALASCESQSCASACTTSTSSGGGGSSSGSSSGGTGTTCSSSTTCPSTGETLQFCVVGSDSSCYYEVGTEVFQCASCSDVTSCAQSAAAACQ